MTYISWSSDFALYLEDYSPTCIKQAPQGITKNCLFKAGACLIQLNLYLFVTVGNQNTGLLIQAACLIEVATKTGFIVFDI